MKAQGQTFLSYAKEDLADVRKLYEGLIKRKVNVWFDKENISVGEWRPQITKAIARSNNFIICLSEAALRKTGSEKPGFQDNELNIAYNIALAQSSDNFAIIPIRLESCDRGDHRLSVHQQFDVFRDWDGVLDKLAVRLGGVALAETGATDDRSRDEQLIDKFLGKAMAFHYAGDFESAYHLWVATEEVEGKTIRVLQNKAMELFNLHRYKEAFKTFDEVLRIQPGHYGASFGKQQAFYYLYREEKRILPSRTDNSERGGETPLGDWDLERLEESGTHKVVRAEFPGTFFNSPSPSDLTTDFYTNFTTYWDAEGAVSDREPYIKAGRFVFSPDAILGRIAAYGLFNNVVSECTGRVIKIFVEDWEPVETGQPLFLIEKLPENLEDLIRS
jgi:biotin carboxyl carrier protein